MAVLVGDDGLTIVATGSVGLGFALTAPDTMPAVISMEAMPEGGDVGDLITFPDLPVLTGPDDEWHQVGLTGPLKFGVTYDITVKFDGVEVYTETLTIPPHRGRKGAVLRQRIYETLLAGCLAGEIEAKPYGDFQVPGAVNDGDMVPEGGVIVEVGNYYPNSIRLKDYLTRETLIALPLNVNVPIDDEGDAAEATMALEEVIDYLMRTDWRLNGFGLIQSAATFEGNEPEVNDDRKLAVVRGTLNIPVRNRIVR